MVTWLRAWTVGVLFLAWLAAELLAAFVPALRMRTLTRTVVATLPWPVTALIVAWLVAWLPPHFRAAYRNRNTSPIAASEVAMLDKLAKYNKLWVAVAAAVLQAAQIEIPMSDTWRGWVTVALAGLGALGVVAVPNKQPQQ